MTLRGEKGFTLVELLVAIAILGMIAGVATSLLSSILQAQDHGSSRADLYQEGLVAMEQITSGVRGCTYFLIPNAHNPTRDILAFSGTINDDNDFYFGDTLFPRIDEDPPADMNFDNKSGIELTDDDGDGGTDEAAGGDDDEDGLIDEDPLDGLDNDGDGNIDEDFPLDNRDDSKAGIAGIDDDGDGSVDEGNPMDNDEDSSFQDDRINPVVYKFDNGAHTLTEWVPETGQTTVLSNHATFFEVTWEAPERILITLTLTDDKGKNVTFSEYVCPRNILQKTGKRVR
jgi:prepilin-type N-terminal cleavage/methylation domain-containing protein